MKLDQGNYNCEIVEHQLTTSPKSGIAQIAWRLKVIERVHADDSLEPVEGEELRRAWWGLTDKSIGWVSRCLTHLGFGGELDQLDPNDENWIDMTGTVRTWYNKGGDSDYGEWSLVTPRAAATPSVIDADKKRELGILFGPELKAAQEKAGLTAGKGSSPSDEDIPF
jgi:hypothetical protein